MNPLTVTLVFFSLLSSAVLATSSSTSSFVPPTAATSQTTTTTKSNHERMAEAVDRHEQGDRQIRAIADQLLQDLGLADRRSIQKMNISLDEYNRMVKVYEKSVRQTELQKELHDDFDEYEDDEVIPYHRTYSAKSSWNRRKRFSEEETSEESSSLSSSSSSRDDADDDSSSLFLLFEMRPVADPRANLLLVRQAYLRLTLAVTKDKSLDDKTTATRRKRKRRKGAAAAGGGSGRGRHEQNQHITLTVRQIVLGDDGIILSSHRLSTKDVASQEGEVVIDVAEAAQQWMLQPEDNQGLKVDCQGCREAGIRIVGPGDIKDPLEPELSVEIEKKMRHPSSLLSRNKRSYFMRTISPNDSGRQSNRRVECRVPSPKSGKGRNKRKKKQRCCRERMEIDFTLLDGFEFILQPLTFDAFMCQGRCPNRFNPAHGHALLQSLMHMKTRGLSKKERVPRPCCAASKLSSLPILHLSQSNDHRLDVSHWKNVIVGECKCS